MNNNLIFISAVAPWVSEWFPTIRAILAVLMLVLAVALIVSILFQSSTSSGMGAMAGQSTDTFYAKNKGRSLQGIMRRLTIILAVSILVVTVLYLISYNIYNADFRL